MFSRKQAIRQILPALAALFVISISACQNQSSSPTPGAATPQTASGTSGTVALLGAGSSFVAPLYTRWFQEYNKAHPNVQVSYDSVGSGAGINRFTESVVDFGASDVAMSDAQIAKVPSDRGVVLLPMTAGGIILSYNIPGVPTGLKLSRAVYSNIFLGKITNWNDPQIAALNPNAKLPNLPITTVHRSDASGTTGAFTLHLSAISPDWKNGPGQGTTVEWKTGTGAKGSEGVTAQIQQTLGAIGYVEYGYAAQNKLPMATLENKAGNYIAPTSDSTQQALAQVQLPDNLRAFIADPDGKDSYPIVTYSWVLASKKYSDANKAQALKDVLKWSLTTGQTFSKDLGYVPLPQPVVDRVSKAIDEIS